MSSAMCDTCLGSTGRLKSTIPTTPHIFVTSRRVAHERRQELRDHGVQRTQDDTAAGTGHQALAPAHGYLDAPTPPVASCARMTNCLLISPRFSKFSYWTFQDVCEIVGVRHPTAPLGLTTVAALLPSTWNIRLLDLNVRPMDTALVDWAELVMAGGMLPQQPDLLALIDFCHARGKRIAVGGQDL